MKMMENEKRKLFLMKLVELQENKKKNSLETKNKKSLGIQKFFDYLQ